MNRIEITKGAHGYTVIVDDKFADCLCPDEALGAVAAVLFEAKNGTPYLRTYEQWVWWQKRYDTGRFRTPIALLSDQRAFA